MSLINQKFNFLTIISEPFAHYYGKQKFWKVKCKCDCGNEKEIRLDFIKRNQAKSCGCYNRKLAAERAGKLTLSHNLVKHPLYQSWKSIKNRCYNKNANQYLGGNIIICDEWKNDFKVFYDWSINNGWKEKLKLSRKDLNKNFEPNNCCFRTKSEIICKNQNKEKSKKTCLKKYGVDHPQKSNIIRKRSEETNLKKYGCKTPFQNEEIKEKIKETCLKVYGTENPAQCKKVKQKMMKTNLKKYGVKHVSQNKEIRQKQVNTLLERYGTIVPPCNLKEQNEVGDYLKSLGFEFKSDYKVLEGKELDFYNEKLKFALEYNGIFWHHENSPEPRNQTYHYNKYKKCTEKGVRLITIFSDEWRDRQPQVKAYLKSALGVFDKKIYGRKCEVKIVSSDQAKKFINDYHIQGTRKASLICFGIYFENELLGILSLGRHHRQNVAKTIILDRLCFKDGVQIIGGTSKMFKEAIKWAKLEGYEKIVSWSDNRLSEGKIYYKLGFKLDGELGPDLYYVDLNTLTRLCKQSQKKKIMTRPKGMTRKEWAAQQGIPRIWDCGKKRFVYDIPQ